MKKIILIVLVSLVLAACGVALPGEPPTATTAPVSTPLAATRCIGENNGHQYDLAIGESDNFADNDGVTTVNCESNGVHFTFVPNTPVPTAQPTATEAPQATATPATDWKLGDPPQLYFLPDELSNNVQYVAPPENCAKANNPNMTCSTRVQQPTHGDFILRAGEALVMTGDGIEISQNVQSLAPRPSVDIPQDLWVIVNTSDQDVMLTMDAPNGSFRGYFRMLTGDWTTQYLAHIVNLHLQRFLNPQNSPSFTPTPVPNCGQAKNGCKQTEVRVLVWTGIDWVRSMYGTYNEGLMFWWQQAK